MFVDPFPLLGPRIGCLLRCGGTSVAWYIVFVGSVEGWVWMNIAILEALL